MTSKVAKHYQHSFPQTISVQIGRAIAWPPELVRSTPVGLLPLHSPVMASVSHPTIIYTIPASRPTVTITNTGRDWQYHPSFRGHLFSCYQLMQIDAHRHGFRGPSFQTLSRNMTSFPPLLTALRFPPPVHRRRLWPWVQTRALPTH
jgi:hypothetical protein